MANVRMRVVQLDGEIDAAALGKLLDGVFPSPHPPAENIRAVGQGLENMMASIGRQLKDNKPFKLHVENKPKPANKGGRPSKKSATPPAPAAQAPAKS